MTLLGSNLSVSYNSVVTTTTSNAYATGSTHLILGMWTVGAGNDQLDVWVDPNLSANVTLAQLGTPVFSANSANLGAEILRVGVLGHGTGTVKANLDALYVSNTAGQSSQGQSQAFYEVTGVHLVPEPATTALLVLGLAARIIRRRR